MPEFGELTPFDTDEEELEGVAAMVASKPASIRSSTVVLARTRQQLEALQTRLRSLGVPASISLRRDRFASAEFAWLHATLRLAADRSRIRTLEEVVGTLDRLTGGSTSLDDIAVRAESTHGDLMRAWVEIIGAPPRSTSTGLMHDAIELVRSFLIRSDDYRRFVERALRWFEDLRTKSGEYVGESSRAADQSEDSAYSEDLRAWTSLAREIAAAVRSSAPLEVFLQELDLRSKEPPPEPNAVALMTIHSAKGREFADVYLIGLGEGVLPSYQSVRAGDTSIQMEEERRNCFVAITRVQERLTLTYAKTYRGYSTQPSRFLREMGLVSV